ncbi:hypothetical protein NL108_014202 [Boleophthalmus pectinirostris]|uniref:uncharacterized protein LOC129410086 isoform X3 n=1 Tax=Boleophthalmus pectinirostris TaxID=150288 RepID=UPI0024306F7E|nr:uncharacterized protein LOC129410086 isoform X3 [Boleophthalmus pectinirostris]KAJ0055309.1 hypothetical protein NL108_014202 [Boleophthalmus pectinirostris]
MEQEWILLLICVAFGGRSSACPPQSLVVRSGSDVSLSCNLSSSEYQTWFRLDSDRILPLFSVRPARLGEQDVREDHHTHRAVGSEGNLEVGVSLEIRSVTQDDSGVYICSSKDQGQIRYNTAVHLTVTDPGDSPLPPHSESCWDPGFCLLPGVISAALLFTTLLLCYCKGRCSGCCCGSDIAEDGALHYSSLKHLNVPRPFGRADVRLVQEDVIYDTVNQHGNFQSK